MSTDLITAFSTGFTSVAADVTTVLGAMIPIAIGIMGTLIVAKKAMKWFKSMV